MSIARWQSDCTIAMSWVTSTTVAPGAPALVEDVHALLPERGVADGEHLVDQHDVGVRLDHDREGEADQHPGRVVLELEVDEVLELGELEHGVEPATRLAQREAHQHAVEDAVLAGGQLRVEAHAELDEGRDAAGHTDAAGVGPVDAREDLQQAALAGPVAPDDPEELALVDVEGDVPQRPVLAVLHARERVRRPLLEGVDAVLRDAERLLTPRTSITTGRSMQRLSLTLTRPAMIAFGSSITRPEVYRRCAEPGIRRAAEPDSEVLALASVGSIFRSYNAVLDAAAGARGPRGARARAPGRRDRRRGLLRQDPRAR